MKTKEGKLVSVITPLFNCEKYLERCINSVLSQTYACFEYILVDDGSSDNSGKIARKYANKYSRIRYIKKNNGGPASARNMGLINARGEYIAFLDADDYYKPEFLEKMILALERNDAEVAVCGFVQQDSSGKQYNSYEISSRVFSFKDEYVTKQFVPFVVWQLMVKKSLLSEQNILFNEKLFVLEDLLFIYHVLITSKKIVYINSILYINCVRDDSLVHQCFNSEHSEKLLGKLQAYEEMDEFTKEYETINTDIQLLAIKDITLLRYRVFERQDAEIKSFIMKYARKLWHKRLSLKDRILVFMCCWMPHLYARLKGNQL